MQSRPLILASVLAGALFTGCAGGTPTRILGDTAGAAGGALLGNAFGKGNPLVATLGAGAGVLASEALQAGSNSAQKKNYATGYEKGRSDAAKQQFQALNDRQRTPPQVEDAAHVRLFEVPLPEHQINGVILAPSSATIRIQD